MVQLQKDLESLTAEGRQVVVISQDSPENQKKMASQHKLSFQFVSDGKMEAAQQLGIVFRIDEDMVARYKGFGIDLVGLYGRTQPLMPVPSVFLVDTTGTIRFHYVNPDYRVRLQPEVLQAAVRAYLPVKKP